MRNDITSLVFSTTHMYMYIEIPRDRHKDKFRWASCDVTCMTRIAFTKLHISITTNVLSVKSGMTFAMNGVRNVADKVHPQSLADL